MWLPDPQYKDASKEHYKAFEDLFGPDTNEIDHSSAKSNVDEKSKHVMKKERVRDAIDCVLPARNGCVYLLPPSLHNGRRNSSLRLPTHCNKVVVRR